MNILITGAKGMVGTALVANLKNIKENKNRTRPNLKIEDIYEYDLDSTYEELEEYCKKADFVFNLATLSSSTQKLQLKFLQAAVIQVQTFFSIRKAD